MTKQEENILIAKFMGYRIMESVSEFGTLYWLSLNGDGVRKHNCGILKSKSSEKLWKRVPKYTTWNDLITVVMKWGEEFYRKEFTNCTVLLPIALLALSIGACVSITDETSCREAILKVLEEKI